MGLNAYPAYMGNIANSVNTDRKVLEWLTGGLSGVGGEDDFKVSPVSGQHQVTIERGTRGTCFIRGRDNTTSQGSYMVWTDGDDIVDLPVPDVSPFIVAVLVRVADSQYGVVSDVEGAEFFLVSGTPSATPTPPSDGTIDALNEPGGWYRLANVRINPADAGEIPEAQITDTREVLPTHETLAASILSLSTATQDNANAIEALETLVSNLDIPDIRVQTSEPTTGLVAGKTVWIA